MEIGKEERTIIVKPAEVPVPTRRRAPSRVTPMEPLKKPSPVEEPTAPTRTPVKEPSK